MKYRGKLHQQNSNNGKDTLGPWGHNIKNGYVGEQNC